MFSTCIFNQVLQLKTLFHKMMNVGWRADGRAGFNIIQQSFEIIIYYFFVELVLNRTVPLSYNRNLELPY